MIYDKFLENKDKFVEVFRKFDNKIVNKRFIDALEKVSPKHVNSYYRSEIPDFYFKFDYEGSLTIEYYGNFEGEFSLRDFNTTFTVYGCHIYNCKLHAESFISEFEKMYETIVNSIDQKIDLLGKYDMVSKNYKKAWELLGDVYEYREILYHGSLISDVPHLYQLRNVYIYRPYRTKKK